MAPSPFFSIIIPTLNEAKYLPKLLANLKDQTMHDFEVIVVDAKSADKTLLVAEKFRPKLPLLTLITSPKKNVSYQRNLGVKKASAKVLLFIDADTQLPKFYLDGIKYKLSKNPADIFITWLRPDTSNGQDKAIAAIINLGFEAGKFIDKPTGMGAMLGITKTAFKKLQGFSSDIHYAEDQEFIRRAVEANLKFIIFKDPMYVYSFRRFRQQGTLKALRKYAKLQSQLLQNGYFNNSENYPMGGHIFKSAPPTFWNKLRYFLKKLF